MNVKDRDPIDGPDTRPVARRRWRRTRDVTFAVIAELRADHVSLLASGVAFGFLLALVPTVVATVSLFALAADPAALPASLATALSAAPPQVADLVSDAARGLAENPERSATLSLFVSLVVATWVASAAASRLVESIEVAYDGTETRNFVRRRALSIVLCAAAFVFLAMSAWVLVWVPHLLRSSELPTIARVTLGGARFVGLAAVAVGALVALYRWAPDRRGVPITHRERRLFPGAFVAVGLWLPSSALFAAYTNTLGSFDSTYGPLGAVVVVMLWLFMTSYVVLIGAEVNSVLETTPADEPDSQPPTGPAPGKAAAAAFLAGWAAGRRAARRRGR